MKRTPYFELWLQKFKQIAPEAWDCGTRGRVLFGENVIQCSELTCAQLMSIFLPQNVTITE